MVDSKNVPKCNWTGTSGKTYQYSIYDLPPSFAANQDGNYIYAKVNAQNKWQPIYIGQGDLHQRANHHHQEECIQSKGATHFHCHLNARESDRLAEERDLLAGHPEAYQPTGCNEKLGG